MLKRTIAICLAVLLATSILLPFTDSNAHGFRHNSQVGRRSNRHRSRAWWRRYRARMRKKRAAAAALAHRNALLSLPQNLSVGNFITIPKASTSTPVSATPMVSAIPIPTIPVTPTVSAVALATRPRTVTATRLVIPPKTPAVNKPTLPTAPVLTNSATRLTTLTNTPVPAVTAAPAPAPAVSNARTESNHIGNEAMILPKNPVTPLPGQLSISVVALARPNPAFLTTREENRLLAGVNVADLRRIVIDKMVVAGGWVTNDFVREINGARVFVVTARTPKNGQSPAKVWTFFFTESGGRVYSLATDSPAEHADRMTKEAERFIGSLQSATPAENPKE